MTSDEFFDAWKELRHGQDIFGRELTLGGKFSFCYIDGNHTYEAAKRDFLNCDAFLEVGGFLLFDDSNLTEFGVCHLMPEIAATNRYR